MEYQSTENSLDAATPTDKFPVTTSATNRSIKFTVMVGILCAVVFGTGGYYFGNQTGKQTEKQAEKQALLTNSPEDKSTVLPNPSVVPSPTIQLLPTQSESPSTENIQNNIGYIKSVFTKEGENYLSIDYIQWLSQAKGECRSSLDTKSKIPACNPNGFLIVNSNPQIRTFEINKFVEIDFSDFKNAGLLWKNNQPLTTNSLSLQEFEEIFSGNDTSIKWLSNALYHIELKNNEITKIRYQYEP